MDQFNFDNFPNTDFNQVNLDWMIETMTQFKEDLDSGEFVGPPGPPGPKGDPGPAGDGLTEDVKQALLQLARKVAYIDAGGQTYYQDLYDALYGTTPAELVSISAAYTQTGTVYDTDSLESLKADLIVTATYSDSSTAVIPAADYTLSGSLTAGTSTITVSYSGETATFQVTVTASAVTLVSISAAFNQGSAVIYESDSLDTLKQYLTVTATYSDSTTATIPSTDYTLSGTLTEGSSTITVSYRGKTDTFQVTVTADPVPVTLVSISATYTQSVTVYDIDSLDSLKSDLVITATYSDSSTAVIPAANYTLSGSLTVGTSTITVSYEGKTTTFNVTVTGATLLYVGASYGHGNSGGSVTFNQDGSITFISTGKTNWGLCYSPYGDANAFKTFEQIKGHTVRLVYVIDWSSTTATTRLVTSAHFCNDLTKYDMTRLRNTNYIDSNANPEYLTDRSGYVDLLIPNDVSSWDGTGTVTNSSYLGFRTYVITNTAGANVTITQRFYDLGVV